MNDPMDPVFRMLNLGIKATEARADHAEREATRLFKSDQEATRQLKEALENIKALENLIVDIRGQLEAAKTGAQMGPEERAVLRAACELERNFQKHHEGNAALVDVFEHARSVQKAVAAWRATGRSL